MRPPNYSSQIIRLHFALVMALTALQCGAIRMVAHAQSSSPGSVKNEAPSKVSAKPSAAVSKPALTKTTAIPKFDLAVVGMQVDKGGDYKITSGEPVSVKIKVRNLGPDPSPATEGTLELQSVNTPPPNTGDYGTKKSTPPPATPVPSKQDSAAHPAGKQEYLVHSTEVTFQVGVPSGSFAPKILHIPALKASQEHEITAAFALTVGFETTSILANYTSYLAIFGIAGKDLNEQNNKRQILLTVYKLK